MSNRLDQQKQDLGISLDFLNDPPGTLKAPPGAIPSRLSVMAYSKDALVEESDISVSRLREMRGNYPVMWINLEGHSNIELLKELGVEFGLHSLSLEDILSIAERPKRDDYGDYLYLVARMPVSQKTTETEQVSVILGKGYIITVLERPSDCFDGIRSRIRNEGSRLRESDPDYLAYALLDRLVDAYLPLLDSVAIRLDELELMILERPKKQHIQEINEIRKGLIRLHRYLVPLRGLTEEIMQDDNPYFTKEVLVYVSDSLDHIKHACDLVESYRDNAKGLMDLYLSMMSQLMNEVMMVLTIVATIFIPLTFIAGIYGMNFDPQVSRWNMPELGWPFGYILSIGMMLLLAGGMLVYFFRKGWLRR